MPAWAMIAIVIGCALILAVAGVTAGWGLSVTAARRRFGPEYQRLSRRVGPRRARAELTRRRRRVAGLAIRPLTPEQRARHSAAWDKAQERFVDDPAGAVASAAALISAVAADRGYPADNPGQLAADLSVSHAHRLDGYRRAEETARQAGAVRTEDLRQALLRYRALFRELLESRDKMQTIRWGPMQRGPRPAKRRLPRLRMPRLRMPRLGWPRPGRLRAGGLRQGEPDQRPPRQLTPGQPPG